MEPIKRLGFAVYLLAAMAILSMGATAVLASATEGPCDQWPAIGTCPGQYNEMSCLAECIEVYNAFDGQCDAGCCFCFE